MPNIGERIELKEKSRKYIFPDAQVVLENVIELIVRESGTHRIRTKDGKMHIIPTGWVHIEIDDKDWTV